MTYQVIGIDPGVTTGVCILGAKGIIEAWQDDMDASHRQLALWLRANKDIERIAVEKMFMGEYTKLDGSIGFTNKHSSIEIAEHSGETMGWLKAVGFAPSKIVRPYPQTWRSALGIKVKGRDEKEAMARDMAKRAFGREFTKQQTHTAEAYCLAQWAWGELAFSLNSPLARHQPR